MADANPTNTIEELPEIDLKQYRITPKFEEWRRLYLDKTNKETFGNATKSAIQAYNLDPVIQYGSARIIGHENLTKHNHLAIVIQEYLTENGFTLPTLIAHALQKMADPKVKTTHWWKEIMILAGYKAEKAQIEIKNNTQFTNIQVTPEESAEFKTKFRDFIKSQKPALTPDPTIVSTQE